LNILPQSIIDRLNGGERVIADRFDDVAVVFSDFVGFTEISARLPVTTVVSSLNEMFSGFDAACAALGVEKIKTIGDAYLAAAGLPHSGPGADPGAASGHIHGAADLALTMLSVVEAMGPPWRIRVGIHNGPVVAGVIGTSKFVYDLWATRSTSRADSRRPRRLVGSRFRHRLRPRCRRSSSSSPAAGSTSRERARPKRSSCSTDARRDDLATD
jgi:class 3 adenylate cyclase